MLLAEQRQKATAAAQHQPGRIVGTDITNKELFLAADIARMIAAQIFLSSTRAGPSCCAVLEAPPVFKDVLARVRARAPLGRR